MALKITKNTTIEQMVMYAKEELGVELVTDGKSKADLIAELQELEAKNGLNPTVDEEEAASTQKAEPELPKGKKNPSKVVINIAQPPAPDEGVEPDTHCELGLNGRIYQIQYGEDVTVPFGVYDILRNAVQTKYYQKKNQQTGQQELHSKQVRRYAFSVVEFIE